MRQPPRIGWVGFDGGYKPAISVTRAWGANPALARTQAPGGGPDTDEDNDSGPPETAPGCTTASPIDVTFSGVNSPCVITCEPVSSGSSYIKEVSNLINGTHPLTSVGGNAWEGTIIDGFTYDIYNSAGDCLTLILANNKEDVFIRVECADGLYTIHVQNYDVGIGDNFTLFEDLTGVAFGGTMTSTSGCGGVATLS